jgi:hypothetical protein
MIYDLALQLLDDDDGISDKGYQALIEAVRTESADNAEKLERVVKAANGRWYILSADNCHCDDCGRLIDNAADGCVECPGFDYRRDVLGIPEENDNLSVSEHTPFFRQSNDEDGMFDIGGFWKE